MSSPRLDRANELRMGSQERVTCLGAGEPNPEVAARKRLRRLCAALIVGLASAPTSAASFARDRVALVVGNGRYEHIRGLVNPENDARAITAALRELGFRVQEHLDLGKDDLEDAIEAFAATTVGADAALFFYAGHAVQRGGQNYLLPTDVPDVKTEEQFQRTIDFSLIDFELVLRQLQTARTSLLFLDACRNDPFEFKSKIRSSDTPGGLAPIRARIGTLIAYATEPYNVAFDGTARHSPFTEALLRHIDTEGLEVRSLMTRVRADVANATNNQQVPWDHSSLLTEFYFKPKAEQAEQQVAEVDSELQVLTRAMAEEEPQQKLGALQSFVGQFPNSQYRSVAEIAIRDIVTTSDSSNRPPQVRQAPRAIVSADEISAPLDIPKPFDPDGDRLQIQVVEIPDHGVLRSSGRQIRVGDTLSVDQLTMIHFYPPPSFKGPAILRPRSRALPAGWCSRRRISAAGRGLARSASRFWNRTARRRSRRRSRSPPRPAARRCRSISPCRQIRMTISC